MAVDVSRDDEDATVVDTRGALREGKRLLKEKNGPSAMVRFEKALLLARGDTAEGCRIREKRALRGLAAAHRLCGNPRKAILYLENVLEVSAAIDDHLGDTDALGVIADCYTELGDYELAATYYDRYLVAMDTEGVV